MSNNIFSMILVIVGLLLTACAPTSPTQEPTASPVATFIPSSLDPQPVSFLSTDGKTLAGLYWPPKQGPAPGVILMHEAGNSKEMWLEFAAVLQGTANEAYGSTYHPTRSYAVLAFDFAVHGVDDAEAALDYFRSLPGVDPTRIVMIGSSIGADAAVDACGEGCIGAVSLSPGSFLHIAYNIALAALGDKAVLCVQAEDDWQSKGTCRNGTQVGLRDYQVQIYQGGEHGKALFSITDQEPLLADLILKWLDEHLEKSH